MISLETAQKLKDAGLGWTPHTGDYYYRVYDQGFGHYDKYPQLVDGTNYIDFMTNNVYHAPSLSQLLAEIEAHLKINQWWEMAEDWFSLYELRDIDGSEGSVLIFTLHDFDSPDEAAAQALLWIIEQEKGE